MINVSDEIKQAYELSTTQVDKIIVDGKEYRITNVQYQDDCYSDGNIFGTAIAKTIEFEIENIINLEEKEFEYLTGIVVNGVTKWISLGKFIVQEINPNDTTNINKVTAMDYMLKSNIEYKTKLDYSSGKVTILNVLQEACNNSGLVLATTDFANKDFIVDSNQFAQGSLNRQVIQAVAQISGTVAKIRSDNKLYLIKLDARKYKEALKVKDINSMKVKDLKLLQVRFLGTTIGVLAEKVFSLNSYKEAEIKRNTHPINLVSLGMSDVEGENVVIRDEESIAQDGENALVINDNPFAYTEKKRGQLITALFDVVKGFQYTAYSLKCQGLPFLETLDKIQFLDREGNTYDSFVFRFNYKSPKGLESTIEAPSITKATVNYQNVLSTEEKVKRTELRVDKQEQKITAIIESQTEQGSKISSVEQDIDGIRTNVSSVETKVETAQETANTATTKADNAQASANNAQSTANTANKNAQKAQETANGAVTQIETTTTKLTQVEQTVNGITQEVSEVVEKVETVENTANTAESKADEAQSAINNTNNNLSKNYYTKTETNSQITQKANEITSQVSETYSTKEDTATAKAEAINSANSNTDAKLKNYSTTTQMDSAITQKANEITSEVTKKVIGANYLRNSRFIFNENNVIEKWNIKDLNASLNIEDEINWLGISVSNVNYVGDITQRVDNVKPKEDYTFSFLIKNTGKFTSEFIYLYVTQYDVNGNYIDSITQTYQANEITEEAMTVKVSTTSANNANYFIVGIQLDNPPGNSSLFTMYIANAKLENGDIVTDWSPNNLEISTNIELNSKINQTEEAINLEVRKKVGNNEIISKINQTSEEITIDANRININGTVSANGNFKVDTDGNLECNNAEVKGWHVSVKARDVDDFGEANFGIETDEAMVTWLNGRGFHCKTDYAVFHTDCGSDDPSIYIGDNNNYTYIRPSGITTPTVTQTSLESIKKNIEEYRENATEIVKNSEIYKYNLKNENDTDKKHIGFVIADEGGDYKTPEEVISNNEGIDTYSMCSILWKAVQEQQETIEQLKTKIETLEKGGKQ